MLVETIYGPMDDSKLVRVTGTTSGFHPSNPPGFQHEFTSWDTYWLNGQLVHRSADVGLSGAAGKGDTGKFA